MLFLTGPNNRGFFIFTKRLPNNVYTLVQEHVEWDKAGRPTYPVEAIGILFEAGFTLQFKGISVKNIFELRDLLVKELDDSS